MFLTLVVRQSCLWGKDPAESTLSDLGETRKTLLPKWSQKPAAAPIKVFKKFRPTNTRSIVKAIFVMVINN